MTFRKGQWVKTTRALELAGGTEPTGTVGIHLGPVLEPAGPEWDTPPADAVADPQAMKLWTIAREASRIPHPTLREVHLVHVTGNPAAGYRGGETRAKVAIEEDALEAAVRADVPADRLATYAPDWEPA